MEKQGIAYVQADGLCVGYSRKWKSVFAEGMLFVSGILCAFLYARRRCLRVK